MSAPPRFGAKATVVVNMETTVLTDLVCEVDGAPIPYRRAISAETRGRPPMFCSDFCMHKYSTQMYRRANDIETAFVAAYDELHGRAPTQAMLKTERSYAIELLKTHPPREILAALNSACARLGSKFTSLAILDLPEWTPAPKQKKRERKAS